MTPDLRPKLSQRARCQTVRGVVMLAPRSRQESTFPKPKVCKSQIPQGPRACTPRPQHRLPGGLKNGIATPSAEPSASNRPPPSSPSAKRVPQRCSAHARNRISFSASATSRRSRLPTCYHARTGAGNRHTWTAMLGTCGAISTCSYNAPEFVPVTPAPSARSGPFFASAAQSLAPNKIVLSSNPPIPQP